jgi:hypothetical protein
MKPESIMNKYEIDDFCGEEEEERERERVREQNKAIL